MDRADSVSQRLPVSCLREWTTGMFHTNYLIIKFILHSLENKLKFDSGKFQGKIYIYILKEYDH